jgi:hypothetical protein
MRIVSLNDGWHHGARAGKEEVVVDEIHREECSQYPENGSKVTSDATSTVLVASVLGALHENAR